MSLRKIQISAVVVVFMTFFLASAAPPPAGASAAIQPAETTKNSLAGPVADWTFEGCWTQFAAGPCRDVFRDPQGNYWICRACGTTGNPGPGKCSQISSSTLATGFWCS